MCPIRRHCPYTRTRCTRHTSQAILAHSFSRCTFREPLFNIRGQPVHKLDSDHDSGFPEGREANVIQLRYPAGREEIKDEYGLISEGQKDKEGSPHTHTHTHTQREHKQKTQKVLETVSGPFLLFPAVPVVCGVYRTCRARAFCALSMQEEQFPFPAEYTVLVTLR